MAEDTGAGKKSKPASPLKILQDSSWQFVGVVVSLIATLLSVVATYGSFQQPSRENLKALQVVILANIPVVQVDPSVASPPEIVYEGESVTNIFQVDVMVENYGNQPIRGTDYEQPIEFVFPLRTHIFQAELLESYPSNVETTLHIEANSVTLSPVLLNPEDRVTLRFVVGNMPANPASQPFNIKGGRIAGVQNIPVVTAANKYYRASPRTFAVAFAVISILSIIFLVLSITFLLTAIRGEK
jgi:hypothetical protein